MSKEAKMTSTQSVWRLCATHQRSANFWPGLRGRTQKVTTNCTSIRKLTAVTQSKHVWVLHFAPLLHSKPQ